MTSPRVLSGWFSQTDYKYSWVSGQVGGGHYMRVLLKGPYWAGWVRVRVTLSWTKAQRLEGLGRGFKGCKY